MKLHKLYLTLFLIISVFTADAYKNRRAILIVNKDAQQDSFSFNIVSEFTQWIYTKIEENKIHL